MTKFRKGDIVQCVSHEYIGIGYGWTRRVLDVYVKGSNEILVLMNRTSPYQGSHGVPTSEYLAHNFVLVRRPHKTKEPAMAYEKKQWIGLKIDPSYTSVAEAIAHPRDATTFHNSQHAVRVDVSNRIEAGDHWIVLETVAMIKGEDPRPPISITEYK